VTPPDTPEVTPVSGAIGAACEVPETAAKTNAATAIAKTVRIIVIFSFGANLCEPITRQHGGGSAAAAVWRNEQTVRIRVAGNSSKTE
jgi:hypothetical protein